ncbi:hypothetical protein HG537_0B06450 [Torulaspora globosa]|uniref:Ketopantoate reductase C-terminal domain-containing protein n=1 Tax=Torulaspora globosa TaxID=48254 RepID=A0A7H9HRI4_9SACH|nr:hypothetical protein HG537_0B06450 [Torulaspora sp. CBS 2947]
MGNEQLRCLIVGETPAAQLIGWRLSLGSSFIILISNYVSSDGLVAWKSSKLGANFYTPNIFAKNAKELAPKLLDENRVCKYPLDIMLVSAISIEKLQENCKLLSKFVDERTIVLISADFGCELEKIAINAMGSRCRCVLSVACDVECRQLSLGSYALVNDDNCEIYLGNSYSAASCAKDSILYNNIEKVQEELNIGDNSSIARMVHQLEATKWIKVEQIRDTKQMALRLWQLIIPKISLNILSIIYEQFDYEKMLENKSTEIIFRGLVHELLEICLAQCNSKVDEFVKRKSENNEVEIDFVKIIDHCKRKRNQLISTTANEYPEYLFLPFELYCFYHRFEYPAQILLYQPILLAEEYNVSCSNLNFLYGFYSRLLSLSGLSINGGRLEQVISQLAQPVEDSTGHPTTKECRCKSKSKMKDGKMGFKVSTSKSHGNRGIFSISSPAGADYTMPSISGDATSTSCDCTASNDHGDAEFSDRDCERDLCNEGSKVHCHCRNFDPLQGSNRSGICHSEGSNEYDHGSANTYKEPNRASSQSALDDMSAITLPHFTKRYSTNTAPSRSKALVKTSNSSFGQAQKPRPTSSLEMQLRSDRRLAKEYQDLYGQLLQKDDGANQKTNSDRAKQFVQLEKQLWNLQRRYNIMNGTISDPRLGPYSDLLNHMEILCGENNSDIIRLTTSRYGDLDLYTSIEKDKEQILTLFKRNSDLSKKKSKNDRRIANKGTPIDNPVRLQR